MKVPVLLMCSLHAPTQQALEQTYEVHRYYEATDPKALLATLGSRCQIAVTSGGRGIEAAVMSQMPGLKLVSCFGVGVDAIDLDYARTHGIAVTNTPDVLTEDVADLALALLLGTIRRIPQGDRFVREGRWLKGGMALTQSLQARRVGVIGLGRIGAAIAKRCAAFNTDIAYFGPREKPASGWRWFSDLVEMATWADVLIAACPGGEGTRGLVSREVLTALGPEGVFVNIARGSVVDQAAMVELLADGRLGAAGLDVFEREPQVPAELIAIDRVVLHPHQGSATHTTRAAMGKLALDNVAAYVAGKPLLTAV